MADAASAQSARQNVGLARHLLPAPWSIRALPLGPQERRGASPFRGPFEQFQQIRAEIRCGHALSPRTSVAVHFLRLRAVRLGAGDLAQVAGLIAGITPVGQRLPTGSAGSTPYMCLGPLRESEHGATTPKG